MAPKIVPLYTRPTAMMDSLIELVPDEHSFFLDGSENTHEIRGDPEMRRDSNCLMCLKPGKLFCSTCRRFDGTAR